MPTPHGHLGCAEFAFGEEVVEVGDVDPGAVGLTSEADAADGGPGPTETSGHEGLVVAEGLVGRHEELVDVLLLVVVEAEVFEVLKTRRDEDVVDIVVELELVTEGPEDLLTSGQRHGSEEPRDGRGEVRAWECEALPGYHEECERYEFEPCGARKA